MRTDAGKKALLSFAVAAIALHAVAQEQHPVVAFDQPAYRVAVEKAVFRKIKREHYQPRAIDDAYSNEVWSQYIKALDPGSIIFQQKDIDQLAVFKNKIDDELNAGTTEFFDAVYPLYRKRIQESSVICMAMLQQPFDLQKKDSAAIFKTTQPFSASDAARKLRWRRTLQYSTLQHYMDLAAADKSDVSTATHLDAAREVKAREQVRNWYIKFFNKEMDTAAIGTQFSRYMATAVAAIDPHTAFTAPEDQDFNQMLTKRYYGIGIELGVKAAEFYVKRMLMGGTAYKSGQVKENDLIVSIADSKGNMMAVSGLEATQVAALIRGEKGSTVTLQLQQPGGALRTVAITRDEVIDSQNKAKSALIHKDGKTFGYIYLPLFYMDPTGSQFRINGAAMDVGRQLMLLQQNNVDGVIVDLRGNGGGSLDEVVSMGGYFVEPGIITQLKSRDGIHQYESPTTGSVYDGPLTVLVDENSASASEIFTAAMQDRGRALIVGTTSTFGKGTAQTIDKVGKMGDALKGIPDTAYGTLRLTKQKFYRITGAATQLRGVVPDVVLQDRMSGASMMEKEFPAVLSYDSIAPADFDRLPFSFNYNEVVRKATDRVHASAALQQVAEILRKQHALREQPVRIDLEGFQHYYKAASALDKQLAAARELAGDQLLETASPVMQSTDPASHQGNGVDKAHETEWLEKLSKDIYLGQTVSVMEDMISTKK